MRLRFSRETLHPSTQVSRPLRARSHRPAFLCACAALSACSCIIIASDGVWGLLGRGLGTKIISNGISAMLFSVLWRSFEQKLRERQAKAK